MRGLNVTFFRGVVRPDADGEEEVVVEEARDDWLRRIDLGRAACVWAVCAWCAFGSAVVLEEAEEFACVLLTEQFAAEVRTIGAGAAAADGPSDKLVIFALSRTGDLFCSKGPARRFDSRRFVLLVRGSDGDTLALVSCVGKLHISSWN
jgi:hypothetical protein